MTKDRFLKWPLSKSPKSTETCIQSHYGPSQSSVTAYYALSRFITFCFVQPVFLRLARFYRGKFFDSFKIWHGSHGNHGLPSLSIPLSCAAPRAYRFLNGGLKRGRGGRREPSVNLALYGDIPLIWRSCPQTIIVLHSLSLLWV